MISYIYKNNPNEYSKNFPGELWGVLFFYGGLVSA